MRAQQTQWLDGARRQEQTKMHPTPERRLPGRPHARDPNAAPNDRPRTSGCKLTGKRMAEESTSVICAALAGNILVALSKFGAAFVSGSSAVLTQAIHSTADTTNQVLLLVGNKRSKRRKSVSYAFGYGVEVYFWTFVVAVVVLLAGGVAGATGLRESLIALEKHRHGHRQRRRRHRTGRQPTQYDPASRQRHVVHDLFA
jgi:Cation efflux family